MSKADKLRKLYSEIEVDSTDAKVLLSLVRNGTASDEQLNDLLDIVKANINGGRKLDEIKNFENKLIRSINKHLDALDEIEIEYNDTAHCEDESEQNLKFADLKQRYKKHSKKAEKVIEAIEVAYFQIDNFDKFENRLYNIRENLAHFE
jgi:hypothetical protein